MADLQVARDADRSPGLVAPSSRPRAGAAPPPLMFTSHGPIDPVEAAEMTRAPRTDRVPKVHAGGEMVTRGVVYRAARSQRRSP